MPAEFWRDLRAVERSWPLYIDEQARHYQQEYGPDIRNRYDLYRHEQAHRQTGPGRKSLNRLVDLAALEASCFDQLRGRRLDQIAVVAWRQGRLRHIPFDLLEFTQDNRIVLPCGPEANPADGDGIFNHHDHLIFMAADCGDRIGVKRLRDQFRQVRAVEEVAISRGDEQGWVYVLAAPSLPLFDEIRFYPQTATTCTPFIMNQCAPRLVKGRIVPTLGLRTWAAAPHIGGLPVDSHNRLHIDSCLQFKVGQIRENEDDFDLSWRAWYDGRVIFYARSTWRMKTPLGIGAPTVFADIMATPLSLFCYPSFYTPFDPSLFIRKVDFGIGEDLNPQLLDLNKAVRFITPANREGSRICGASSPQELELVDWLVLAWRGSSICVRTSHDDYLSRHAALSTSWRDCESSPGCYSNNLSLASFDNRQQHFYVEWNIVPWFWNADPDRCNWANLELVLSHRDKPLQYAVGSHGPFELPRTFHVPDIKEELVRYRY